MECVLCGTGLHSGCGCIIVSGLAGLLLLYEKVSRSPDNYVDSGEGGGEGSHLTNILDHVLV